MKTLFYFRSSGLGSSCSYEIFGDTILDAQEQIKKITAETLNNPPILIMATQNYSCPKCSCQATECNYG